MSKYKDSYITTEMARQIKNGINMCEFNGWRILGLYNTYIVTGAFSVINYPDSKQLFGLAVDNKMYGIVSVYDVLDEETNTAELVFKCIDLDNGEVEKRYPICKEF